MDEEQRPYAMTASFQRNVGMIGVPCLGCGQDIDRQDYIAIQAGHRNWVALLHPYCATLFSEELNDALAVPLPPPYEQGPQTTTPALEAPDNPAFERLQARRRHDWTAIAACCAYEHGELSEIQLAWLLNADRMKAQQIYQRWLDRERMSVKGTDRMAWILHGPVRAG